MGTAIGARQRGDDFQAYLFWQYSCALFDGAGVRRIGFEVNEFKAFDDVAIEYARPKSDGTGGLIDAEYYQVKFSRTYAKEVTAEALTDPKFTNADSFSILQRLKAAVDKSRDDNVRRQFVLICPWRIPAGSPLGSLITTSGRLDIKSLLVPKKEKAAISEIRELWKRHLGITSDPELARILTPFVIEFATEPFERVRDRLLLSMRGAGFRVDDITKQTEPYSQLIWRLSDQGWSWFTSDQLQAVCSGEGLWVGLPKPREAAAKRLGFRSFVRWADNINAETDAFVCLCSSFSGRAISAPEAWQCEVLPRVAGFLSEHVTPREPIRLTLHCHGSISFLVGYLIEPKSGVRLGIRQSGVAGNEREWWRESVSQQATPWDVRLHDLNGSGHELAVAISATHSIENDVLKYVRSSCPSVCKLVALTLGAPSQTAIRDGKHACELVEAAQRAIAAHLSELPSGAVHLFWAAPNAFITFLGQLCRPFSRCTLYEYDFDKPGEASYTPSLVLNPSIRLTT